MKIPKPQLATDDVAPTMSYDEAGLLEHTIDETDFRLDAGRQGTALALSSRPSGTWDWVFVCELKWDGLDLSSRALGFDTLQPLSRAFRASLEDD